MSHTTRNECRIYVGNLPPDIRTKDIQDLFHKFGKVTFVDLKNRRGPPFAFVEFEDARDAEDAVKARDGYDYDGYRLRVEFPRGGGPGSYRGGSSSGGTAGAGNGGLTSGSHGGSGSLGRSGGGGDRNGGSGGGRGGGGSDSASGGRNGGQRGPVTKRSQYRVLVSGLPASGSWQDLKDHMREAGDVCFADTYKDGSGVVEFLRHEDMKYAIKKLDDSRFRSHEGEVAYVRVREDTSDDRRGGDHNRDRSRSRSSYSPRRRRGTPTYSPVRRDYSRSRSGSRSNY